MNATFSLVRRNSLPPVTSGLVAKHEGSTIARHSHDDDAWSFLDDREIEPMVDCELGVDRDLITNKGLRILATFGRTDFNTGHLQKNAGKKTSEQRSEDRLPFVVLHSRRHGFRVRTLDTLPLTFAPG